ncbi:MAG: dihydroorotate dehydrogenase electron transfer subunit [Pseudomonadota bacterium]
MNQAARKHAQRNRGSLFVETGQLLARETFPGEQYILRIYAPRSAAAAQPGSFVHITCDDALPMRRPLSIMRVGEDWIEVLFKIVGDGLRYLADKRPGDHVSVLGPIGQPFRPDPQYPNCLLIGGGVGIPPMVFLADFLRKSDRWNPIAMLGSEIPFPFDLQRSRHETSWLNDDVVASMPLMEEWDVPSRLASLSDFEGCMNGYVTDLARAWLEHVDSDTRAATQVFTCGPTPMLKAVADLAAEFDLPCQVSVEEFMACAVGGCAGCTIEIETPDGPAMKRVCVDGPVFEASTINW